MTSDLEKATATRAVEALEDLHPVEQLERAGDVYSLVFGLAPWPDASPSYFPSVTTIRLWRGWDTHRELLRRIQAVRASAYNAVGRSDAGRPISTVAARTPTWAWLTTPGLIGEAYTPGGGAAVASGFAEGLADGAGQLGDLGRGYLDKLEKLGPVVVAIVAGVAVIYVARLVKG